MDHVETFKKGALISQNPASATSLLDFSEEEKDAIGREHTHKWSQPSQLYFLACMCKNSCDPLAQADFIFPQQCALLLRPSKVWMKQSIMVPRLFTLTKTYVPYRWLCYHRLIFFLATQHHFQNIQGLVVGAPYLACAIIGCWLTEPLNRLFARRGTIFTSCVIAAVASVWEGVANTWVNIFIARFFLGLGIGSKSSTVPVYAAGKCIE
jgi:hypothetical protein